MANKGIVLRHVISHDVIDVDKSKIDLIANLAPPTYVKDVRLFLGNVGFYICFTQNFSKIAKPLTNLLAKYMTFTSLE